MPARLAALAVVAFALPALAKGKAGAKTEKALVEAADEVTSGFDKAEATVKTHLAGAEVVVKKAVTWEKLEQSKYQALVQQGYVTLPNGTKVKSKHFFSAVNHVGKALASIGTHLINDVTSAIQMGRHASFADRLKVAETTIVSLHNPSAQWKKANLADVQAQQRDLLALRTSVTSGDAKNAAIPAEYLRAAADGGVARRVSVKKPWQMEAGEKRHVGAYLRGSSELWGDAGGVGLHTDAVCGGHLLHDSRELLHLKADLAAPKSGVATVQIDGTVDGKSVFSVKKSAKDGLAVTERPSKTFDVSATVPIFSIGLVHVVAKMGISGTAGFEYGAAMVPGAVGAHLTPFVKASAYVQAAVKLAVPVAEAGAAGALTLIDDELEVAAHATLVPAQVAGKTVWGVFTSLGAHNQLRMLQGDLSIFAKLHYPCVQDAAFRICTKEASHSIVKSKGIEVAGDLFREKKFTSLGVAFEKLKL